MTASGSIPSGKQRDGTHRTLPFAALFAVAMLLSAPYAFGFGFDDVAKIAAQRAATSYKARTDKLPDALAKLDYDHFRDIRFKPDRSLWRPEGLPFEIAFFHEGQNFKDPVKINELVGDVVREVRFKPELFDYGANVIDPRSCATSASRDFACITRSIRRSTRTRSSCSSAQAIFARSARASVTDCRRAALAVDTALGSGEEFPRFVEFWIETTGTRCDASSRSMRCSTRGAWTGAYRFVVKPGVETAVEVKTRLFLREIVGKLGVAPLTSMYFFGENQRAARDDYRPEVHDSDGLSVAVGNRGMDLAAAGQSQAAAGDVVCDGQSAPDSASCSATATSSTTRTCEARYELRPSAWIEPKGMWGTGRVELVQIPSPDETNDNIVAYWVPDTTLAPQQPFDIEYRILWQKDSWTRPPTSWVTQTRRGRGYVPQRRRQHRLHHRFRRAGAAQAARRCQGRGDRLGRRQRRNRRS